ncbi:hypothetical protein BCR34DRAFT_580405 [Clohesyomyces aquaticus]|uniref:Rhodopsin domain-containing protein n=1 Tax=Clohesyomyces aquaticus TaxID=1231657 RepID=A0A1Y1Y6H8_9PLEO|nr:hypothetical protein BCR34DRAFT_580405 [Clohesyomyces aquaticus]
MPHSGAFDPALLKKLPKSYLEEDLGHRLIIFASVFLVLQTLLITLFYIGRYLNKTLNGLECWLFMPIGYIFSTAVCILGFFIVKRGGAGRHVEAVLLSDPGMISTRAKIDKAVEYIYILAITGSKLAILCLYLRIFRSRSYRLATYSVAALVGLNWLAGFLLSCTICQPCTFQWDKSIPGGHCGEIMQAYLYISVPNILTDILMLILPLPAIYRLHIDLTAKIGLFATFLMGSSGLIASILRLVTFVHAGNLFKDPTYRCIPTYTYTIAESGTHLIAASMPTLRPLKRHLFPQHSFTKFLDSVLIRISGKESASYSFSWLKQTGAQSSDKKSTGFEEHELRSASTTKLNDVSCLGNADQQSQAPSSKRSQEFV